MMGVLKARVVDEWVPAIPLAPAIPNEMRWDTAWGAVGVCVATASSWSNNTGTATDITATAGQAPTITFTPIPGRRYRVYFSAPFASTVATDVPLPILIRSDDALQMNTGGNQFEAVITPVGGSPVTWKMQARRSSVSTGNITISATTAYPILYSIEDIGPVSGSVPVSSPIEPWTSLSLNSGWILATGTTDPQPPQYRKVGDEVQLRGIIQISGGSNPVFVLPVGFRPPHQISFPLVVRIATPKVLEARMYVGGELQIAGLAAGEQFGINYSFSVTP